MTADGRHFEKKYNNIEFQFKYFFRVSKWHLIPQHFKHSILYTKGMHYIKGRQILQETTENGTNQRCIIFSFISLYSVCRTSDWLEVLLFNLG